MSEKGLLETNQEEGSGVKKKKRKWGRIIGIGFWPVVLLFVGIALLITKDDVFIEFLNPTSDVVYVNFYKYTDGIKSDEIEYKVEAAPDSDTSKRIKKGTYTIEITKDNQLIRTIDNYSVETNSKKITYLDVTGDYIYAAFDASYLYEGNESSADDYFEYFDSQEPFQVIGSGADDYHITQFDALPDELKKEDKIYMLVPIPRADITDETDDEAMNQIINNYINEKLNKTIENSDELDTIIDKKVNGE